MERMLLKYEPLTKFAPGRATLERLLDGLLECLLMLVFLVLSVLVTVWIGA